MNRYHRNLMIIRIVVLILVGLVFLIARFAKAQEPSALAIVKRNSRLRLYPRLPVLEVRPTEANFKNETMTATTFP